MAFRFYEPPLDLAPEGSHALPKKPPSDWINFRQTKEERRQKYWLIRSHGYNSDWAKAGRDWCMNKVERLIVLQS